MTAVRKYVSLGMIFFAGSCVLALFTPISTFYCNAECQAQYLYKNPVFFAARAAMTNSMQQGAADGKSHTHVEYSGPDLGDNGIKLFIPLDDGKFILVSKNAPVAMVASPTIKDGSISWSCSYYIDKGDAPKSRHCSFD